MKCLFKRLYPIFLILTLLNSTCIAQELIDNLLDNKPTEASQEYKTILSLVKYLECPNCYEADDLMVFTTDNWWLTGYFISDLESKIIRNSQNESHIEKWFEKYEPRSSHSRLLFKEFKYQRKKCDFAPVKQLWANHIFDINTERRFIREHAKNITESEIQAKIGRLLWGYSHKDIKLLIKSVRAAGSRKSLHMLRAYEALALNPAKHVSKIGDYINKHSLNKELSYYLVIKNLLRLEKDHQALSLIKKHNFKGPGWWRLKHIIARNCIKYQQYKDAYNIVTKHELDHTSKTVENYEKQWLSGWIASSFLHNHNLAITHFRQAFKIAKLVTSSTKIAYWAGRTREAQGRKDKAKFWYKKASRHPFNFYGQLALLKLGNKYMHQSNVSQERVHHVSSTGLRRLVRAAVILNEYGYYKYAQKLSGVISSYKLQTHELNNLITEFNNYKAYSLAVDIAKPLINRGYPICISAYPVPVKLAHGKHATGLYWGLIRQESGFAIKARSIAGAEGLMQIMPNTSKQLQKTIQAGHISSDAIINLLQGSHYIDTLFDQFHSYILAIASYNAGEKAVNRWIKAYGNPNLLNQDTDRIVDWIEMIPYGETRFYITKVIENFSIYELLARLRKQKQADIPITDILSNNYGKK